MIHSNELRSYNFIYIGSNKTLKEVTAIFCNGVCVLGDNKTHYCPDIEPIPLTAEILRNNKFDVWDDNPKKKKRYEGDVLANICGFEFTNSEIGQEGRGFYCWQINDGKTIISYVHQLQNFHFSIKGIELTLAL